MKQVILDTSFIITCVKQKIRFIDEIPMLGLQIAVPKQVLAELEGLSKKNSNVKIALSLVSKLKTIDLKTKNTDKGIIDYAKKNPGLIIATLDREIKSKVKNKKLIIRGKKKLEIL